MQRTAALAAHALSGENCCLNVNFIAVWYAEQCRLTTSTTDMKLRKRRAQVAPVFSHWRRSLVHKEGE